MSGRTIVIDSIKWHYEEMGSGRPILMVHGNTGSSAWWTKVMDQAGRRCVAPDLPNFGRSDALPGKVSIEAYAEALAGFVRGMGLQGCIAVGHSLGGAVCQALAARHPELLEALVLVDSAAPTGLRTPESYHPAIEAMRTNRAILHQALKGVVPTMKDEALFERLVDDAALMAPAAWIGNAVALGEMDFSQSLRGFDKPVLVIAGRMDYLITEAMARETAAAFPRARLELLDGVGHSVIVEDPVRFLAVLDGWLG